MVSRWRPDRRKRHGQAMVEFAIVATVTLTLIFGIIQSALAIYAYSFGTRRRALCDGAWQQE
jgi:hypothetical protein